MPRGIGEIPSLRLETLQKFVTLWTAPPGLILQNVFPASDSPSSTIKWESQEGSRGMTPFVPPGAPAPTTAPHGVAAHSAEAAYWKEKMHFDEEFLNNIRKEGTETQYMSAVQRLAKELNGLQNRSARRKEWMFSKMLFAGSFDYSVVGGTKISVDYSLPSANSVTLTANYKWSDGTQRDMLGDVIDGKKQISDECGGKVDYAFCNSTVLRYLAQDPSILALLQKTAFGEGDLFKGSRNGIVGVNPKVLGSLLDIDNLIVYDEKFEARTYLTAVVTADTTSTITVEDTADFEAGGTLRFHDVSADSFEDETISSITTESKQIVVASAPSTSYKAGEDYVSMVRPFIPDTTFAMMASMVEGQKIAEYKRAPFALDRHYGTKVDRHEEWDPEGVWIRVQDKGLPILYQRDAVYILTVA